MEYMSKFKLRYHGSHAGMAARALAAGSAKWEQPARDNGPTHSDNTDTLFVLIIAPLLSDDLNHPPSRNPFKVYAFAEIREHRSFTQVTFHQDYHNERLEHGRARSAHSYSSRASCTDLAAAQRA
jgi:hypothetical protein